MASLCHDDRQQPNRFIRQWSFVHDISAAGQIRHPDLRCQDADLDQSSDDLPDSLNTSYSSLGESEKDARQEKPPFSYVALITMAIKSSRSGRLTLSEIYDYLINNFEYFRRTRSRGWMNAVRHNLTLNDCFVKLPRDPLMRGKGSYWSIDPQSRGMFNHGSLKRRRTRFKRAREEIEVVRDILLNECSISPQVGSPPPQTHPRGYLLPCSLPKTTSPYTMSNNPPKRKFSNFSVEAILSKDSVTPTKQRKVFNWHQTEIWQC
eukprot:gene4116-20298_t